VCHHNMIGDSLLADPLNSENGYPLSYGRAAEMGRCLFFGPKAGAPSNEDSFLL